MRNWMWIVLAIVFVLGAFLLFGSSQDTTEQPGVGGGPGILPQQERMEVQLNAVSRDQIDQSGSAVFEEKDGVVTVSLDLNMVEGLNNQPAHIHVGVCPGIGEIVFPLNNVVDGKSVTEINTTMDQLKSQSPLALNVHKSAEEIAVYTACGNLPQ